MLELPQLLISPLPFGPRIRDFPNHGWPRRREEILAGLKERDRELTTCYRWARQRDPELEGSLAGRLLVNEWGSVAAVSFHRDARTTEVARCVEGILLGRAVGDGAVISNLRSTRVPVTLRLKRSGLGRPRGVTRPAMGVAPSPPPGVCVIRPSVLPEDETLPVELEVSDHDHAQEREEQHEEARRAWVAMGRKGPRPWLMAARAEAPRVLPGRAVHLGEVQRQLAHRLTYNLGAYRECYLASARQVLARPRWRSSRHFVLSFDSTGFVDQVLERHEPAAEAQDRSKRNVAP